MASLGCLLLLICWTCPADAHDSQSLRGAQKVDAQNASSVRPQNASSKRRLFVDDCSHWSRDGACVYIADEGNLPLVISAPHDGTARPSAWRDRPGGRRRTTTRDMYSSDIAVGVAEELGSMCRGNRPYMIKAKIHRQKVDFNRDKQEAADGNWQAEEAWAAYTDMEKHICDEVRSFYGEGFWIDFHGYATRRDTADKPYTHIGYRITKEQFNANSGFGKDDLLQGLAQSTVRNLAGRSSDSLLRGPSSLGTLIMNELSNSFDNDIGKVLPSQKLGSRNVPQDQRYLAGGVAYTVRLVSSKSGMSAAQLEIPSEIRNNPGNHDVYVRSVAKGIHEFMMKHYSGYRSSCR